MIQVLTPKHPSLEIELFWLQQLPDSSTRQNKKGEGKKKSNKKPEEKLDSGAAVPQYARGHPESPSGQ